MEINVISQRFQSAYGYKNKFFKNLHSIFYLFLKANVRCVYVKIF